MPEESKVKNTAWLLVSRIMFWLLLGILPLLTLFLIDAFGIRYSPSRMDGFDLCFNGVCCSAWFILIVVLAGTGTKVKVHWTKFITAALLIAATFQAYPYLLALDNIRNAELDTCLPSFGIPRQEIASIWPSPPKHLGRTELKKDLDGDRQQELILMDNYAWPGTSDERTINLYIYKIDENQYIEIFNQSVSEESYYDFYEGCPERNATILGANSTIRFLNLNADRSVEIFVHQASETSPPNCRFDRYYRWKDGLLEGFYPEKFWLIERSVFFYILPFIILVSSLARKRCFRWGILITSGLYLIWALVESWLSSDFWAWTIVSGLAIVLLIWLFFVDISNSNREITAK